MGCPEWHRRELNLRGGVREETRRRYPASQAPLQASGPEPVLGEELLEAQILAERLIPLEGSKEVGEPIGIAYDAGPG